MEVNIQREFNSKLKYEKIKKMLNNPIVKFSLSSAGSIIGIGTLGLAAKLIYDKIHKKKKKKKFIKKNFFLSKWEKNSCWNDVFIQFLMCPEYRCKKFKSQKINAVIKIINDFLNEKYDGEVLRRSKLFKYNERPIPDGFRSHLDAKEHYYEELFLKNAKYDNLNLSDMGILDILDRGNGLNDKEELFLRLNTNRKINNCFSMIVNDNKKFINKIFCTKSRGFYPTFIIVLDRVHYQNPAHSFACYIIYDKSKEAKYFLLADGLKNSMEILSKEQGLKELQQYEYFHVKYSSEEIVNQFYTLED